METPETHVLNGINWQFFGMLTSKSERLPERVRLAMFFAYLRQFCRQFGLKFPKLLWCLRQEQVELTGLRHFHYLIAGAPASLAILTTCFWLQDNGRSSAAGWRESTCSTPD